MNVKTKILEIIKLKQFDNKQLKIEGFYFSSKHVDAFVKTLKKDNFEIFLNVENKCLEICYETKTGKGNATILSMDSKLSTLLNEHKKLLNAHSDMSRSMQKENKKKLEKLDREIAAIKI